MFISQNEINGKQPCIYDILAGDCRHGTLCTLVCIRRVYTLKPEYTESRDVNYAPFCERRVCKRKVYKIKPEYTGSRDVNYAPDYNQYTICLPIYFNETPQNLLFLMILKCCFWSEKLIKILNSFHNTILKRTVDPYT